MTKSVLPISLFTILVPMLATGQLSPVGSEFQVNSFTTQDQYVPSVCSDAGGNFVVSWSGNSPPQPPGDIKNVFAQRFESAGQKRGTQFQVNTYTVDKQGYPVIACGAAGQFVIVWGSLGQDGNDYGVFGQRYSSSGDPVGTEFQVNTYTLGQQDYPSVGSDAAGNFVVVWASDGQDGDGFGVFGRRYASSGTPLSSEFQINTWSTGRQSLPMVADDADGGFVVVWTSFGQDGDEGGVFGQRFDSAGLSVGTEFQVNTYTTGRQYEPAISTAGGSGFVVVWTSSAGDGYYDGVFGQRFDSAGADLGTEFLVNTYTSGSEYTPVLAVDPAGNFVVVWTSYSNFSAGVFGRRFDSTGDAVGSEFQISTDTSYYQRYPVISAQGVGAFVVAWQSYDDYSSTYGIIGRRFATSQLLGDCNGDGRVATNELVISVYIALDTFPISDCPAIDPSDSGSVTVEALVGAVANALAT